MMKCHLKEVIHLENSYGVQKKQENEQAKEQKQDSRAQYDASKKSALASGMQKLNAGVKLKNLTPEEAREVIAAIGNQTVLKLIGGEEETPLANKVKLFNEGEDLPLNKVEIRWPALFETPSLSRKSELPNSVFQVDSLREMGVMHSE